MEGVVVRAIDDLAGRSPDPAAYSGLDAWVDPPDTEPLIRRVRVRGIPEGPLPAGRAGDVQLVRGKPADAVPDLVTSDERDPTVGFGGVLSADDCEREVRPRAVGNGAVARRPSEAKRDRAVLWDVA